MSKSPAPYPTGQQTPAKHLAEVVTPFATQLGATVSATLTDVDVTVPVEKFRALVEGLRERSALGFDYLRNIAGVDYEADGMAVKYQFYSFERGHAIQVTVPLPPYANPHHRVPSLADLYPAADWHEREAAEMFGIDFTGHPNLKNLLLEEDMHIHPLLKAHPLQVAEIKQGIEDGPAGFTF
jgi:NADH-quinone oxidoreductase subunit C